MAAGAGIQLTAEEKNIRLETKGNNSPMVAGVDTQMIVKENDSLMGAGAGTHRIVGDKKRDIQTEADTQMEAKVADTL